MSYSKYAKLRKYMGGIAQNEWKKGRLIASGLTECEGGQYNPPSPGDITRWVTISGQYVCDGTTKYTKEKQEKSSDNGATWVDTGNIRTGSIIETNSVDCGYIVQPIYQWVTVSGEYVCVDGDKMNEEKQQVSYDSGSTWEDTGETRTGSIVETESSCCDGNEYICEPIANLTWTITEPVGKSRQGDIYLGDNVMNHDCVPIEEWPADLHDCYDSSPNYCYVEQTDTRNNIYYHQSITDSTATGLLVSQKMYYYNGNNGDCMSLTTFLASGTGASRVKTTISVFNGNDNVAVINNNLIFLHGFYVSASPGYDVVFTEMVTDYVLSHEKYYVTTNSIGGAYIYNVNKNKLVKFQVDGETSSGYFTYKQKDNKSLYIYYNKEATGLVRHRRLENWTLIGEINVDTMEVTRYYK